MTISDLTTRYVTSAPKTFVLKLCIGLIVGLVAHKVFKLSEEHSKKYTAIATVVSSAAGMIFNIFADPIVGYFYKTYILGVPQDLSKALAKIGALTTSVNAVIAVIFASVILPLSVIYYGIRYDDITKVEILFLLGVHSIMLLGAFGAFIDDVFLNNNTVKENSASKSYHYNKNNVDMVAEISKELDCTLQFKGFKTIRELKESCSEVPSFNGVYLVLRRNNQQPVFSISSLGGYVKVPNDSPCYSLSRIQQASAKLRNVFVKALLWC